MTSPNKIAGANAGGPGAYAAGASFVGDAQASAGMGLADPEQGFLQGVQVVGDGAVEADFALGTGLSEGEGDGLERLGKPRKEFRRRRKPRRGEASGNESNQSLWTSRPIWSVMVFMVWLLVRVYLTNPNAYPAQSEDVRAALPTRATRDIMNGNHTVRINPASRGLRLVWPVSHKVSTNSL